MAESYPATVSAGSLRSKDGIAMPHAWTTEGVRVESEFTGAHVLHLSVAGCVLNDVYREADRRGLDLNGVQVTARGAFEPATWRSTGIDYEVALDSSLTPEESASLLAAVAEVAEIPRALGHGVTVRRVGDA